MTIFDYIYAATVGLCLGAALVLPYCLAFIK